VFKSRRIDFLGKRFMETKKNEWEASSLKRLRYARLCQHEYEIVAEEERERLRAKKRLGIS